MSADEANEIVTYWLIPAEPARSFFRTLINDLAQRFDAPVFEPHVTLYVTTAGDEQPARVLETVLGDPKPLRLFVAGIDFSDEFTKTLFVQFQPDAGLQNLSEKLRTASGSQREYELNPHLSLIYQKMPIETKRELVGTLKLPFRHVDFDSVHAVISPAKIEAREDVQSWRVVATKSFVT